MEEVTKNQVDPAVLIILVDRICNDIMGPHFINMHHIYIPYIYILCVFNIFY